MCTSLVYTDANGATYVGRTVEMDVGEPYFTAYVPAGATFRSEAPGYEPLVYSARHAFIAVAAPGGLPAPGQPIDPSLLKASEGLNEAGLTFSLNAYPTVGGDTEPQHSGAVLQAADLGSWILSQFSTAAEVKEALGTQSVHLTRLPLVGNAVFPFHVAVNDRTGGAIVLEWHRGELDVHDNPVRVLTNGPEFTWHLTNLNNWTHLSNVDRSSATFGSFTANQPDSGIATDVLPGSNAAVGRFIRAVYYSTFAEKVNDPDEAMLTLARIMNNFDRPRGATIDLPSEGGAGVSFQGTGKKEGQPSTEYTALTLLSDTGRGQFLVRSYDAFNFSTFDLNRLAEAGGVRILPVEKLSMLGGDTTEVLLNAGHV